MAVSTSRVPAAPVLALVGRPNVGKSTLFNRLTGTRDALVAELPGLTRDRQYGFGRHDDRSFIVVDTGGLGPEAGEGLARLAADQARVAIDEADALLFMVDAQSGLATQDEALARELRRGGKPLHLVVNKSEGAADRALAEFAALGFGAAHAVSATNGQGVQALLEQTLSRFPSSPAPELPAEEGAPRITVIGRPNVGKSTLVNRLLGESRLLSSDQPGTTRDAIEVPLEFQGQRWTLVDTAGLRRRSRVTGLAEKLSVVKTLQAIDDAEVVIALVDAQDGIGVPDARLIGLAAQRGRAMVLAVNKWDGLDASDRAMVKTEVERKLPFLDYVPLHYISALHGSGLGAVMKSVLRVHRALHRRIPTPKLNDVLEAAVARHAPPAVVGRRIKLRYAHLGGDHPPLVVIHGNQVKRLPESYKRYLANAFRKAFKLEGVPLKLAFRIGENPYRGKPSGRQGSKTMRKR